MLLSPLPSGLFLCYLLLSLSIKQIYLKRKNIFKEERNRNILSTNLAMNFCNAIIKFLFDACLSCSCILMLRSHGIRQTDNTVRRACLKQTNSQKTCVICCHGDAVLLIKNGIKYIKWFCCNFSSYVQYSSSTRPLQRHLVSSLTPVWFHVKLSLTPCENLMPTLPTMQHGRSQFCRIFRYGFRRSDKLISF